MIVSASYRTDIPAFYGKWFLDRLEGGFCRVASPYGGTPYEVSLRPGEVDGIVFWTRNLKPLLPHLPRVSARAPFVVQFTVTAYPRSLDSAVIEPEAALAQLRELRRVWGPRVGIWRYDPILISSLTPPEAHRASFARLADALQGVVDEVVVSFAQLYRKTARNLAAAARRAGFSWRDPDDEEKRALLAELAEIARDNDIELTLCTQPRLLAPGLKEARCIDAARLSDVAGRAIDAREKGNREGCRCAESRDIGAYDTCPHGCVYCYAVSSRAGALARLKTHDAAASMLG